MADSLIIKSQRDLALEVGSLRIKNETTKNIKTGSDEWGQVLPINNFRAYGDYPLTLNLYFTVPFVLIFGLNEFSIRLPHVILGTLTVMGTYYLTYGLTKKRSVGLIAAFLLAVEPWTVFTSRIVLQQNLSIYLVTFAAAFYVNRDKNKLFLPLSFLLLFLTLFSYHSTRIFSPLILLSVIFIKRKEILEYLRNHSIKKSGKIISVTFVLIFFGNNYLVIFVIILFYITHGFSIAVLPGFGISFSIIGKVRIHVPRNQK